VIGTFLNVGAVLLGGLLGTTLGARLPERMRETVLHGLGLVTLTVGVHLTLQTQNVLIVMGSILVGALLGEWWRLDDRLHSLAAWLQARVQRDGARDQVTLAPDSGPGGSALPVPGRGSTSAARFIQGFVTASLVFCVGPMTVLGSIQDGLTGDYTLLAIKSLLDGFAALAFAASLGIGVVFSVLTILVYQGTLTLLAAQVQHALTPPMIAEMTATGGVLIVGIGLLLLELKRIRLASFLPALLVAPLIVALAQRLGGIGS
jgi:uncharacterized membrane protein YqgA involved in biofilm formation